MSDNIVREHVYDAVQQTIGISDDMPEGTMLKGFVLIAEWVSPDGNLWLSQVTGGASSERLPDWTVQGLLHNVLHDWPDDDE